MKHPLLLASALLLATLPVASADTFLCQPAPTGGTSCVYAYTDNGNAYVAACAIPAPSTGACAGGGHYTYPGVTINDAGAGACAAGGCASYSVGQYAFGPYFLVGTGGFVGAPGAASASAGATAGTYNGAPYHFGGVCGSSVATGGTCLLV